MILKLFPRLTQILFLAPVGAGLLGTALLGVGLIPDLNGSGPSLAPVLNLLAMPGLETALGLSLASGLLSTMASCVLAFFITASLYETRHYRWIQAWLSPLLATPHASLAIGLAFVIAPSGLLFRAFAFGAHPPDIATVQDPLALGLTLSLILKETPYLLLMIMAALNQLPGGQSLRVARSLGYGPVTGWLKVLGPQVYTQVRLPIYAALAYGLSNVDMALILGPTTPPTLAVFVLRLFQSRDLAMLPAAGAGAMLQLGLVVATIAMWRLGELVLSQRARGLIHRGQRGGGGGKAGIIAGVITTLGGAAYLLALASLGLWSVARTWRYPDLLPASWSLRTWSGHLPDLAGYAETTLYIGLAAVLIALVLAVGCLENENRAGLKPRQRWLWLTYLPLIAPQIAFLFGVQVMLIHLGLDGSIWGPVWAHLIFVFPYLFLSLADPWRALDKRYEAVALGLGASRWRVFWRIRLPLMVKPLCLAAAIGFSVSIAQYLPTLFAGGGRFATLTTEAITLAAGGERRVVGVYAFVQGALPLLAYGLALTIPSLIRRRRFKSLTR